MRLGGTPQGGRPRPLPGGWYGRALTGLTLVWFDRDGHRRVSFPDRPWYPEKEEPSYADILGALRRESWRGQFAGVDWEGEGQETPLAQLIEFVSRAA